MKGYACQRPSDGSPHNKDLVEAFEFLEHARDLMGKWAWPPPLPFFLGGPSPIYKGDSINSRSYRIAASVSDHIMI